MALEVDREELLEMLQQQQRGGSGAPPAAAPRVPPPTPDVARTVRYPVRTETITSQGIPDIKTTAPAGIACLLFGIPLWLIGAVYTARGWSLAIGLLVAFVQVPVTVPAPDGWIGLAVIAGLGLLYSVIEVGLRPRRRSRASHMIVYGLVLLTDIGSTLLGLLMPAPDAWPLTTWLSQTWPAALVLATVLTFLPEVLIVGGERLLRKG